MKYTKSHIDAVEALLHTRFERQIRTHQVMSADEARSLLGYPPQADEIDANGKNEPTPQAGPNEPKV